MEPQLDPASSKGRSSAPGSRSWLQAKLPLWVSLVLLVLLAAVYGWGHFAARAAQQQLEIDRAAIQRDAAAVLARQTGELETLFGAALAWSVRSSMLRNNLDEIDQYFVALVRNPRISLVLLADADGRVLRATDRQFVDTDFATHFPAKLLSGADVSVHADEGKRRRLVLPVQGLNARLGTVLLVYTPPD